MCVGSAVVLRAFGTGWLKSIEGVIEFVRSIVVRAWRDGQADCCLFRDRHADSTLVFIVPA